MRRVGDALTRRKGVGVFGSALLRREGVRGFGFGVGCSGVIQMARDGRRQVGIGRIGVGSVTVVTKVWTSILKKLTYHCHFICHWTLTPVVITVTHKQIASVLVTMRGNKDENAAKVSTPQLFD